MTTKTLGQVLYEAEYERELAEFAAHGISAPYAALTREEKEECERIAQAVAAVVREQCAQAAWSHYMDMCKKMGMPPAEFGGWCAASAIRAMK